MRTGTEFDIFPAVVVHPVRDRHETWNPKIAGDVEHPKPAAGFGKLVFQITDVQESPNVSRSISARCNRLYHQIA